MDVTAKSTLKDIGLQLDQQIFPRVKNGGFVTPSELAVPLILGEEKYDGNQRRSAFRPQKGSSGGEGRAGRSRSARQAAPLVGASIQTRYEAELEAVCRSYTNTTVWWQEDGLWLLTQSSLLPGLGRAAIFLTAISDKQKIVRGWGFWRNLFSAATWIGPRHTNFPDGSICAFHPTDGTWNFGDSIVELLDLYSLWALRHLHLEIFGRWPGPQAVSHPYERVLELRDDEYCGCEKANSKYGGCCLASDFARNRIADAVNFITTFAGGLREPPSEIVLTARGHSEPPELTELLLFDIPPRSG